MADPLSLGIYVLLLLPGFILVQTRDYHLLREKRSQFETTLDILLWSAAIWVLIRFDDIVQIQALTSKALENVCQG